MCGSFGFDLLCTGDEDGDVPVSISVSESFALLSSSSISSITVDDSSSLSSTSESVFTNASRSLVRFLWLGIRGDVGGQGNLLIRVISFGGDGTDITWLVIVELLFVTIDPAGGAGAA